MAIIKEQNLLELYFDKNSTIYKLIQEMRSYFINNIKLTWSHGLIEKAKQEVQDKNRSLDASTYIFAQDISNLVLQGVDRRVIMLVEGAFLGSKSNIESTIPIDLEGNIYRLFKPRHIPTTIDEEVTRECTSDFIQTNLNLTSLLKEGYTCFQVDVSRFFSFEKADLTDFFDQKGVLDTKKLVAYVSASPHIVLDKAAKPSFEDYLRLTPTRTSYRLKKSLISKLLDKLCSKEGKIVIGKEEDKEESMESVITDWVAHRIVVDNEKYVHDLVKFFKSSPQITNSKIEYLYTKRDYYTYPRKHKYKAVHIVVSVSTKNYKPCIREIQIIDKSQLKYFQKEILGEMEYKRDEKKQTPRCKKELIDHYRPILYRIFGSEKIIIPF